MCRPTNSKPRRVHAIACYRFYDIIRLLTVSKHIKHRGHATSVLDKCTPIKQVIGNPKKLTHHNANDIGTLRGANACQFLHRHDVRQLIHHPTQIINAVGIRNERMPSLTLRHLLRPTVMIANVRDTIHNLLTIKLQHQTKRPMSRWVVWPDV